MAAAPPKTKFESLAGAHPPHCPRSFGAHPAAAAATRRRPLFPLFLRARCSEAKASLATVLETLNKEEHRTELQKAVDSIPKDLPEADAKQKTIQVMMPLMTKFLGAAIQQSGFPNVMMGGMAFMAFSNGPDSDDDFKSAYVLLKDAMPLPMGKGVMPSSDAVEAALAKLKA